MTFVKGQSGNPGGRPKELKEVIELARSYCPAAMTALHKVATKGKSESAKVAAAEALLNRGYGKPPQSVRLGGDDDADPIQHQHTVRWLRPGES